MLFNSRRSHLAAQPGTISLEYNTICLHAVWFLVENGMRVIIWAPHVEPVLLFASKWVWICFKAGHWAFVTTANSYVRCRRFFSSQRLIQEPTPRRTTSQDQISSASELGANRGAPRSARLANTPHANSLIAPEIDFRLCSFHIALLVKLQPMFAFEKFSRDKKMTNFRIKIFIK